ncbi:hypothetical protein BGX24_005408 [Mortierella sp. AD032]|nr:hypothetical protein BGX24_005408 [Mortierella sp. AD032]
MRIISLSLGLAAIAIVAAQQDPLAAPEAQQPTFFEWTSAGDVNQLAVQLEDLSYQITEPALRAMLLRRPDEVAPTSVIGDQLSANGVICDRAASSIPKLVDSATASINKLVGDARGGPIAMVLNQVIEPIKALVSNTNGGSISSIFEAAYVALSTAVSFLKSLGLGPMNMVIPPIVRILEALQHSLRIIVTCKSGLTRLDMAKIEVKSCYLLADIYRSSLANAAQDFTNIPKDSIEEDLQRYLEGASVILDNASKTSIAATNEALLVTRPIFSADLLDRYRVEILRSSSSDKGDAIKSFAVGDLGAVVAFSNGLEACLHVASDAGAPENSNEDEDDDEDEDDEEKNGDDDDGDEEDDDDEEEGDNDDEEIGDEEDDDDEVNA